MTVLGVLDRVEGGDFTARMPLEWTVDLGSQSPDL
jgi:hypothetical protein